VVRRPHRRHSGRLTLLSERLTIIANGRR
jgi:hypothetical protein